MDKEQTQYKLNRRDYEKCLNLMECAQQEAKAAQTDKVFSAMEQEKQLAEIRNKLQEQGITPRLVEDFDKRTQRKFLKQGKQIAKQQKRQAEKEIRGPAFGRVLRYCVYAATCGIMVVQLLTVLPTLPVVARYKFRMEARGIDTGDGMEVIWNNAETNQEILYELDKVYQLAKEKAEIKTIYLDYMPEEMVFSRAYLHEKSVLLEFDLCGKSIQVSQASYGSESSHFYVSDRKPYDSVFNQRLNRNIPVAKAELPDGSAEFQANFEEDDTFYYIQGIMEEEEFEKIVKYIRFN